VPQVVEATVLGLLVGHLASPERRLPRESSKSTIKLRRLNIRNPKGGSMPTVIAHHDVKDKDHWLASPKRKEVFGPLGVTNIRTFVDPQNPTRVAVLMDVADMDVVMGAMQKPEMAAAMEYDGVLPETLVILVEA